MFPDRFRAIAVDGVIDPQAWVGSAATARPDPGRPAALGRRRVEGAAEILRRCAAAGPAKCEFSGSPLRRFRVLAERLKGKPITVGTAEGHLRGLHRHGARAPSTSRTRAPRSPAWRPSSTS